MKLFNAGALRGMTNDARLSAANDLVQRTLAQHGLSSNGLPLDRIQGKFTAQPQKVAPLPKGATFDTDTFTCNSGSRSYLTYVPASAPKGVTGVVVMLHGCTQNPADFAAGTGMNALAEQHRFVVVYPAQSRGDNAQSCWNWFSRGDQNRGRGEPEIIAEMTRKICATFDIDKHHTFAVGLSAGAAMAVVLGQTYPDVFSAVGAHSGLPYGAAKDVASALAAMAAGSAGTSIRHDGVAVRTIVFHGTADTIVHPTNGESIARQAMDAGPKQTTETTNRGETAGRSFTQKISSDPHGAAILEHWTIDGLGHAWSGGQPAGSYTDQSSPDASAEMVRFFFDMPHEDI